jgi:hypothetical protein
MRLNRGLVAALLSVAALAQIHHGYWVVSNAYTSWLPPAVAAFVAAYVAPILWAASLVGLLIAAFGAAGMSWFDRRWRECGFGAVGCSAILVLLFWSWFAFMTVAGDLVALAILLRWKTPATVAVESSGARSGVRAVAGLLATMVIAYFGLIALTHSWFVEWGASDAEQRTALPGDSDAADPAYQVTRGITIHASASAIWPWLVQLGQDRAGIYSYDWLERAAGFGVHNAYRIVPEWQHLAVGDFVRMAPPKFMGGMFGPNVGFRVTHVEPNRTLALGSPVMNWDFELVPVDQQTTRLLVRARIHAERTPIYYLKAAFSFAVLEPAHFIMERKMLLTLKEHAESGGSGRA